MLCKFWEHFFRFQALPALYLCELEISLVTLDGSCSATCVFKLILCRGVSLVCLDIPCFYQTHSFGSINASSVFCLTGFYACGCFVSGDDSMCQFLWLLEQNWAEFPKNVAAQRLLNDKTSRTMNALSPNKRLLGKPTSALLSPQSSLFSWGYTRFIIPPIYSGSRRKSSIGYNLHSCTGILNDAFLFRRCPCVYTSSTLVCLERPTVDRMGSWWACLFVLACSCVWLHKVEIVHLE